LIAPENNGSTPGRADTGVTRPTPTHRAWASQRPR